MKTLEESKEYFDRYLKSTADAREKDRQNFLGFWKREMKSSVKKAGIAFLCSIAISISGYQEHFFHLEKVLFLGPFLYLLVRLVTVGLTFNKKFFKFQDTFKETLIVPFINFVAPHLRYVGSKEKEENKEYYYESLTTPALFETKGTSGTEFYTYNVQSHEEISGKFGTLEGVAKSLAFVNWQGNRSDYDHLGGLYFESTLNERIDGHILIEREYSEKFVGGLLSGLLDKYESYKESNFRGAPDLYREKVKALSIVRFDHDPEFEKNFRVKATNPELAKSFLTDKRIEWLKMRANDQTWPFSISFQDQKMTVFFRKISDKFLTLPYLEYNNEVGGFDRLKPIHDDLNLLHTMGEELNLKS